MMQTHFYFLRQLSKQLDARLKGWVLGTCFSQDKDELVFGFWTDSTLQADGSLGGAEFYIRAVLQPTLATLVFYKAFHRARQNSVALFKDLVGLKVLEVLQFENERAFSIRFEKNFCLIFKLFGNRSNVLVFEGEQFVSMFHQKLVKDLQLSPSALNRPLVHTFQSWKEADFQVKTLFPTFGKTLLAYLESRTRGMLPVQAWEEVKQLLTLLENPTFYIARFEGEVQLLLLPLGEIEYQGQDPIEAAKQFYSRFARVNFLEKEKSYSIRLLEKRKKQTEHYLLQAYEKLEELEQESRHEQLANILMANLHLLETGTEKVSLYDFYHNQQVQIRLKKDLTPQKNAEVYYRKSKNAIIEVNKLKEAIELKENELKDIEIQLLTIKSQQDLRQLRAYMRQQGLQQEGRKNQASDNFKQFEFMGYQILVGRNARNNDLLTRSAYKEDLWLHAKDVPGSHVIVKYQPGKGFPELVVEKAASLAAFFSKRKTDTLCPVTVTPRKFIRKTKDLAEGEVIVEKEEVILVEPREF
jgi:predicted ribosome quality control (RQC) complex YloA/Tae2 family protein